VEIAYLVYVIGLSFDKVCLLLQFLQQLRMGKTQADGLLRQLARIGSMSSTSCARCWLIRWWFIATKQVEYQ